MILGEYDRLIAHSYDKAENNRSTEVWSVVAAMAVQREACPRQLRMDCNRIRPIWSGWGLCRLQRQISIWILEKTSKRINLRVPTADQKQIQSDLHPYTGKNHRIYSKGADEKRNEIWRWLWVSLEISQVSSIYYPHPFHSEDKQPLFEKQQLSLCRLILFNFFPSAFKSRISCRKGPPHWKILVHWNNPSECHVMRLW